MATTSRFIRRMPLQRALAVDRTRHGVGVSTQSLARAGMLDRRARSVIDMTIEKIGSEIAGGKKSSNAVNVEVSKRKAKILAAVREAGYRKLHASEFVAALMDFAGLEKEKLMPYVNAARYLVRNGELKMGGGASLNYYSALVRDNLLERARNALLLAEKPLTTLDIARRIGYANELSGKEGSLIISNLGTCLGLLDLSKRVVKLPQVPTGKKGMEYYLWWAAEHRLRPQTKPIRNYRYWLMQALAAGSKTVSELGKSVADKIKMVKGRGIAVQPKWIGTHLQFLVDSNAVKRTGGKLGGLGGGAEYELTETGAEILDEQNARESITPRMRLLLLGEHQEALIGGEKKKYEHFKLWARVVCEYEKSREPLRLSKQFSVNPKTIMEWGNASYRPFRRLGFIRERYLPMLAEEDPGLAKTFGAWLEAHRKKFEA